MERAKTKTNNTTGQGDNQEITKISKPPHSLVGVSDSCGSLGAMATHLKFGRLEDHPHPYHYNILHHFLLRGPSPLWNPA